jgi:hypothetical protein
MKYTWLVEKYLEGELSGEALQKFELEILRNPEAARELERIRSMQKFMENQHAIMSARGGLIEDFDDIENVISEYEMAEELEELRIKKVGSSDRNLQDFRTRLAEVEATRALHGHQGRMAVVRKASVWVAAASLALLIVTSSLLFFGGNRSLDYMAVYDKYFEQILYDDLNRANEQTNNITEEEPLINSALDLFHEKYYIAAYLDFRKVRESDSPYFYYCKGITCMELGLYLEAVNQFDKLTGSVYVQNGRWYTGLCYLALQERANALSVFQDIADRDGPFRKKSKSILRKI